MTCQATNGANEAYCDGTKDPCLLKQLVNVADSFAYSPFLLNLLGTPPYITLSIVSQKTLKIILNIRRIHLERGRKC